MLARISNVSTNYTTAVVLDRAVDFRINYRKTKAAGNAFVTGITVIVSQPLGGEMGSLPRCFEYRRNYLPTSWRELPTGGVLQ